MRRDYFAVTISTAERSDGSADSDKPAIVIDFDGPPETLTERLRTAEGDELDAHEIDTAYRLQAPIDEDGADGVLSVTNRITGEFVLEANVDAGSIVEFVERARDYMTTNEDEGRYEMRLRTDEETVLTCEKNTFLVYDHQGSLLRQRSLIPSGVEL
jgi:hypothetical protein